MMVLDQAMRVSVALLVTPSITMMLTMTKGNWLGLFRRRQVFAGKHPA